jgi:hypothetical protein
MAATGMVSCGGGPTTTTTGNHVHDERMETAEERVNEDESGIGTKIRDVKRHSEAQQRRCANVVQKLKTLQMELLEDYEEEQLEAAVKTIAGCKGVSLPEVYGCLQSAVRGKYLRGTDDEDPVSFFESHGTDRLIDEGEKAFTTKQGLDTMRDVTQMMKENMKEMMLSAVSLGKEHYETDSDSDYDDEVEKMASTRSSRSDENVSGYLPTVQNPATKWSRLRHEITVRWVWLQDALRNVNFRLVQQNELVRLLTDSKPRFMFDETRAERKKKPKPLMQHSPVGACSLRLFYTTAAGTTYKDLKYKDNPPQFKKIKSIDEEEIEALSSSDDELQVTSSSVNAKKKRRRYTSKSPFDTRGRVGDSEPSVVSIGGGLEDLNVKISDKSECASDKSCIARRCLPVIRPFKQRKIFQLGGIHNVLGKQGNRSTTYCNCFGRTELCAVCSGRSDKVKPIVNGAMTKLEVSALMDHTYHKSLSGTEQKPLSMLLESSLKTEEWKKLSHQEPESETDSDDSDHSSANSSDVEDIKDCSSPMLLDVFPTRSARSGRIFMRKAKKSVPKRKPELPKPKERETPTTARRPRKRNSKLWKLMYSLTACSAKVG